MENVEEKKRKKLPLLRLPFDKSLHARAQFAYGFVFFFFLSLFTLFLSLITRMYDNIHERRSRKLIRVLHSDQKRQRKYTQFIIISFRSIFSLLFIYF